MARLVRPGGAYGTPMSSSRRVWVWTGYADSASIEMQSA